MRAMRGEPLQSPAPQLSNICTFFFVRSLSSGSPKWCSRALGRFQRCGRGFGFVVFYAEPSQSLLDLLKARQVGFKWFFILSGFGIDFAPYSWNGARG